MRYGFFLNVLLIPLSLWAAPKFPFPQNAKYPFGIKPASIKSERIQTAYNSFLKRFYTESGDKARIKWDNEGQTVSEGIGYGMLIMVYMDNANNATQSKFDKLWKYYNSFLNSNQLMHWKINGFDGVAEQNAATDAELDVAAALMQAYKQWGDEKYFNDAKNLIKKIYEKEVNNNGYLKPGDNWDSQKNPSYFSTAALELFKKGGSQDWNKVLTNSYGLIKKVAHSTTGLVPDWCTESGNPDSKGPNYMYDAARTPWRIAWGYVWYGHSDAKAICSKIATWINSTTGGNPAAIVDGYALDGTKQSRWPNSTFLGSFACAGMVDASHQEWLDKAYSRQDYYVDIDESYYNTTLKMLYLLLMSGNMPNLWEASPVQNSQQRPPRLITSSQNISISSQGRTLTISGINQGKADCTIFSIEGRKIVAIPNITINKTTSVLQLDRPLPAGIYSVKIQSHSEHFSQVILLR